MKNAALFHALKRFLETVSFFFHFIVCNI